MSKVKAQLEWIADHNYDSYNSTTSQSNGSVAVYKADVSKLLDIVDSADKYDEVDTDGMQNILNADADPKFSWEYVTDTVNIFIIDKIAEWVAISVARRIIR
jgi:hypothetical protein